MTQRITIQEQVEVEPLWKGSCRCGQDVIFGEDDMGTPTAFHGTPQCNDYETRELSAFMRWLREGA